MTTRKCCSTFTRVAGIKIDDVIEQLKLQAENAGQRRLLVLSGSSEWCYPQAHKALEAFGSDNALWIGRKDDASETPSILAKHYGQWLGRELDILVFDAHAGLDVDSFGAISGTVRAGGIMILLAPGLSRWPSFNDPEHKRIAVHPLSAEQVTGRYLKRLVQMLESSDQLSLLCEEGAVKIQEQSQAPDKNKTASSPYLTIDQEQAVKGVHKVVRGHRRRPLVLTADRGRGKSASLGIAAGQLINEGVKHIIVTAPSEQAAGIILKHAVDIADNKNSHSKIVFIAPDELIRHPRSCDLLLVDEAASIPTPILTKLLINHSRIVFATTVHGYEGTGRGFAIRFKKTLDQKTPQWRELTLKEPVRWAENDPLESFIFKALLLDAKPSKVDDFPKSDINQYRFRKLDPDALSRNEALLSQLFGLLVLAHYQTRPFDLRHLLDGGNIRIYGLFYQDALVATTLTAEEGDIEEELITPIYMGQRRVRGHLLPQSLSNQVGIESSVRFKGLRVLRIAVHPDLQGLGLGQRLFNAIATEASRQGLDYVGTLFGATTDLVEFWRRCGLHPVRIGVTRDSASGTHSALMIKAVSRKGMSVQEEARERFADQFHWLLMDGLAELEADLVVTLLSQIDTPACYQISARDRKDVVSFSRGQRQYDSCITAIRKHIIHSLCATSLQPEEFLLIVTKVLQNRDWQTVTKLCGYQGKAQVLSELRKIIAMIVLSD